MLTTLTPSNSSPTFLPTQADREEAGPLIQPLEKLPNLRQQLIVTKTACQAMLTPNVLYHPVLDLTLTGPGQDAVDFTAVPVQVLPIYPSLDRDHSHFGI